MDIKLFVLLLAIASTKASPIPSDIQTTTETAVLIGEIVVEYVPIGIAFDEVIATTPSEEVDHNIAKRSVFGEDFVRNDILSANEGLQQENELSGLERRIKTLPSWVG